MRTKAKRKNIYLSFVFMAIGMIMITPIYYLVINTFKDPKDTLKSPLGFPPNMNFTLEYYAKAFDKMRFFQSLSNNLIILVFAVVFLVLFSSMAAYAIVKGNRWYHKMIFSVFMVGLIIPFQITIVPLFKLMTFLNVTDSLFGVILVDVFCINMSLSIFLFKGFINTIPAELEEAAAIDGCGVFKTYWLIMFPLLRPIIATVCVLDALAVWNDFMTPLLFLQSPSNKVLLQQVYTNIGQFSTDWTIFFPMLVLAVLPMVIIYLLLQRHIIEGVVAGAVKG